MSERWFHERTQSGWEIRDENRLLVAVVPDALHEREADAERLAEAAACADRVTRMARGVSLLTETMATEIEALRERVRALVPRLVGDARDIAERLESDGPDAISPTWIAMHVRELVEAQTELADERQRLRELRRVFESADTETAEEQS